MPNLVIVNQPLCNRGDQAAHKALIRLLQRHPEIAITVLSIGEEETLNEFSKGIQGVSYITIAPFKRRWRKYCRRILFLPGYAPRLIEFFIPQLRKYNDITRKADYVLCAPGGICMGGYQDWVHVWNLVNAIALKKRTGIYGRSIGPFSENSVRDRIFKKRAFEILRSVDYLSLRDAFSQKIAASLNLKCVSTVDTAFASIPDNPLPEELNHLKNGNYAVFVPNCLHEWHPDFQGTEASVLDKFYGSIIENLLFRDINVVMLPQLFSTKRIDKPYFQKIADNFDSERVVVVDDSYDSDIQQKIISGAHLVIGARYHSIIFAINNEVPFLCLSYEHKMSETLRLLGLEDYSLPLKDLIEKAGGDGFKMTLDRILENRASVLPQIEKARKNAEQLTQRAFSEFLLSLNITAEYKGKTGFETFDYHCQLECL
jgi:colanic acid/amylovoran biosynthesis protein